MPLTVVPVHITDHQTKQLYLALIAMVATFEPHEHVPGGAAALELARRALAEVEAFGD